MIYNSFKTFSLRLKVVNVFKKKYIKMAGAKKTYHVVSVHDQKGKAIDYKSNSEYHNSVPSGAARKVFSAVCREKGMKGNCGLTVVVKQKNKDKEYSYNVSRSKLDEPKELMGRTIEYGVNCTSNNRNCGGSTAKATKTAKPAKSTSSKTTKSKATASKGTTGRGRAKKA